MIRSISMTNMKRAKGSSACLFKFRYGQPDQQCPDEIEWDEDRADARSGMELPNALFAYSATKLEHLIRLSNLKLEASTGIIRRTRSTKTRKTLFWSAVGVNRISYPRSGSNFLILIATILRRVNLCIEVGKKFRMRQKSALIFLAITLAVLLPLLLQVAWPFFTPFILASILAIMLHPAKEWLRARIAPAWSGRFSDHDCRRTSSGNPCHCRGLEPHPGTHECIQCSKPAVPAGRRMAISCRPHYGTIAGRCRRDTPSDRQRSDADGTLRPNERGQRVFAQAMSASQSGE